MKTFETEKGNIPEGATHYSNEAEGDCFAWYKVLHNVPFIWCVGYEEEWIKMIRPIEFEDKAVKPIPQTKEVEWANGDACRYANDIEHEYTYIGEHPHGDGHYVFSEEKGITYIANGYLLEPETEAERKEREELEVAYDLYCDLAYINGATSFDLFKTDKKLVDFWVGIVRKTNYKVKGE